MFGTLHSIRDELTWLEAEGPTSRALIDYIAAHANDFDFFIFFSCRYYHAYHGVRAVPQKAILVPTAERDGALGAVDLRIDLPRRPRAHVQLVRRARAHPDRLR